MTTIPKIAASFETTLANKISSSATSMTLVTGSDDAGTSLSGTFGFVIDEGTASEEFVIGSVSGTAVTSMTRGLDPQNPSTEVTALKHEHRRGATVKITDYPFLGRVKRLLAGEDTFPGVLQYAAGVAPVTDDDLADKGYVDGVAIAGGADASTTIKGISKLSTAPAAPTAPIAVGDNDTRVPSQGENDGLAATTTPATTNLFMTQKDFQKGVELYAADSVGTDSYAITLSPAIAAYANGMVFRFKAGTANTGGATLAVNGLTAKAIVKNFNTALATGDILAGQLVEVQYESIGDNFQMLSPIATVPGATYKSGTTTKNAGDASTTQTIAHGLGVTPKFVRLVARTAINAGALNQPHHVAEARYNGTTQSSQSVYNGSNVTTVDATFRLNLDNSTSNQEGVVTFDATNITITWTKTNNATGTYQILWEAYA